MKKKILLSLLLLINLFLFAENKYWVGGAGNWQDISHWSTQSGGKAGASLPTIDDLVIFDENSFQSSLPIVKIQTVVYAKSIVNNQKIIIKGKGLLILSEKQKLKNIKKDSSVKIEIESTNNTRATFSISVESTDETCAGDCDGTITVKISSGAPNYPVEIRLRNPDNLQPPEYIYYSNLTAADFPYTIDSLCGDGQSYNVRVEDSDGDRKSKNIKVLIPDAIIVDDASQVDLKCNGICDGKASIDDVNGGTGDLHHKWSNGVNDQDYIDGICAGDYTDTITDDNGCFITYDFTITEPTDLEVTDSSYTEHICDGSGGGTIDITVAGGTTPYKYDWDNDGTGDNDDTEDLSGLAGGDYNCTITDDNGCTQVTGTYSLADNTPIDIDEIHEDVKCKNDSNGTIDVTVSGGTSPYTYSWEGPNGFTSTDEDLTNLKAGTYKLTVTDHVNCEGTIEIEIKEPAAVLSLSETHEDVKCKGESNGSIDLTVSGGTTPYKFDWDNDGTGDNDDTEDLSGLAKGTYKVTVSDKNGCTENLSVEITEPADALTVSETHEDVKCKGESNGSIDLTVSGGTTPYKFDWDNDGTGDNDDTEDLSGLAKGTYKVTVSDANGCTQSLSIDITEPASGLSISETHEDVKCKGESNGSIDLTASGGTTPYKFDWDNDGTGDDDDTEDLSGLAKGTYKVTVTDKNGCTQSLSVDITEPADALSISETHEDVKCKGESNGSIDLTVSGGTTPYKFDWDNDGTGDDDDTEDLSGLAKGTYKVTVSDKNGCTQSLSVDITEPDALSIDDVTVTNVTCYNGDDGKIKITVSGGTTPYTFDNGTTTNNDGDFTNLNVGDYIITITDAKTCQIVSSKITVGQGDSLWVTFSDISQALCPSSCIDTAVAEGHGGTANYTYEWETGTNDAKAEDLCKGYNTITVTDANNCKVIDSVYVKDSSNLIVTVDTIIKPNCYGEFNGEIQITVQNGTKPYKFDWSGPNSYSKTINGDDGDIDALEAGTYYLTVDDASAGGCSYSAAYTIKQPDSLYVTLDSTNISCSGRCIGTATATVHGGTSPYAYAWSNGDKTDKADSLCAGFVKLTLSDAHSCTLKDSIEIVEPAAMTTSITKLDSIKCYGECTAKAKVTVSGGVAPYTYTWSSGSTADSSVNLCAGVEYVTIKDANDCEKIDSVEFTQPDSLYLTYTIDKNVTCGGGCNGEATITAHGGTSAYNYQWDDNANSTTASVNDLCAGFYTPSVTDKNSCKTKVTLEIKDDSNVELIRKDSSDIDCFGNCNGSFRFDAQGGTKPYKYKWSNGDTDSLAENLCDKVYYITVTDANDCSDADSVHLHQPDSLAITFDITDESACAASADGEIVAHVTGGTKPYNLPYSWSGSGTANDSTYSDLATDLYHVTVTDKNGCERTDTARVGKPDALQVNIVDSVMNKCHGECKGSAVVSVSGGKSPYTYKWDDSANTTNDTVNNLCAGIYHVTVKDANNCSKTLSVHITAPDSITIDFTDVKQIACNGDSTGSATATVNGGTLPYVYAWSNGDTGNKADSLWAGVFTLSITDKNNCLAQNNVVIQDTSNLRVIITDSTMVSCYGECTGKAIAKGNGGFVSSGYTYEWFKSDHTSIDNDSIAENLCKGDYYIKLTDDSACSRIRFITITQPTDSINLKIDITDNSCNNACDGQAIAHVKGGTKPYSYTWGAVHTKQDSIAYDLCAKKYYFTVTDDNNCQKKDSFEIAEPAAIATVFSDTDMVKCYGDTTGSVTITPQGTNKPYTYLWSNGSTDSTINHLKAAWYYVTVKNAGGCQKVDSIEITQPDSLYIVFDSLRTVSCGADCSGRARIVGNGGVLAYTYEWDNGHTKDLDTTLCFGVHNVTLTDANDCKAYNSVSIKDTSSLKVVITDTTHILCSGQCTGKAIAKGQNGTQPYTYEWSNSDRDTLADSLCAQKYYVTVEDADHCHAVTEVTINENDALAIQKDLSNSACGATCSGIITITTTGGQAGYSYQWNPAHADTNRIENLCDAWYYLTVVDKNNCELNDSVQVVSPTNLTLKMDSTDVDCYGKSTGKASVTVSGGTSPYHYKWSTGDTTAQITNLKAAWYYVTVSDKNNCSSIDSIKVNQPDSLYFSVISATTVACGNCDGEIRIKAKGGTPSYDLKWGANAANQTGEYAQNLCADIYSVTLTDAEHCQYVAPVEMKDSSHLFLGIIDSAYISCYGKCDGMLKVRADSGYVPYTINWYKTSDLVNPFYTENNDTSLQNALCADTLKVTVTDTKSCKESVYFIVKSPDSLQIELQAIASGCYGDCSGKINTTYSGGTSPYTYKWNDSSTDSLRENLCQGTYVLTLSDAHNCQKIDSAKVSSAPEILDSIITHNSLCSKGTQDGSLELRAWGGASGFTYLWSNDSTKRTMSNLQGGWYIVTITDANSCHKVDSAEIRPNIVLDFGAGTDATICYDDTVQLTSWRKTPKNNIFYHWVNTANISDTTVSNPYVSVDTTTTFYYVVDSICRDTVEVQIKTYPKITIDAGADQTILKDQKAQLQATIDNKIVSYLWSPALGLSVDTISNPLADPIETSIYKLRVKDIYGCTAYDSLTIFVIPELRFPSGITPNGDGINDVWEIDYVNKFPNIEIEIFNRWGEQIFYTKGYPDDKRWDGTYNGKPLPVGTYYFLVHLNDGIHEKPITGPITIIR